MQQARRYIMGIDDTDMPDTRGTGALARMLAEALSEMETARVITISRHQLFRDSRVPFTSQNSSASIDLLTDDPDMVFEFSAAYVSSESPEGSDPGIALAAWDSIHPEVIRWGRMAQSKVLTRSGAWALSSESDLRLEGLGGTSDGVIGALAAIGLRRYGDDGRILWHQDHALRELSGRMNVAELEQLSGATVLLRDGMNAPPQQNLVETNGWVRPLWSAHAPVLYVNKILEETNVWRLLTKEELAAMGR